MKYLIYKLWPFLLLLIILNIFLIAISPGNAYFTGEDFQWLEMEHRFHDLDAEEMFLFRPFLLIYFSTIIKFFKYSPLFCHLINYILHFFVSFTTLCLFYMLTKNKLCSFLTAGIFNIHYMNVNVVFTIRRFDELLAVIFSLICIIFVINFLKKKNKLYYILAIFMMILAFLSRETSIVLAVLISAFYFIYYKSNIKEKIKLCLPFIIIATVFLIIRVLFKESPSLELQRMQVLIHEHIFRLPLLAIGLELLFIPFNFQSNSVSFLYIWQHNSAIVWTIVATYFILIYVIKNKHIRFALIWTGITLIPALFYPDGMIKEKYLYLPIIGVAFLYALILINIIRFSKFLKICAFILIFLFLDISIVSRIERKNDFLEASEAAERAVCFLNNNLVLTNHAVVYVLNHRYYINRFAAFPGSCAFLYSHAKDISRYNKFKMPTFVNVEFAPDQNALISRMVEFITSIGKNIKVRSRISNMEDLFNLDRPYVYNEEGSIVTVESSFPSEWPRYIYYFDDETKSFIDISYLID